MTEATGPPLPRQRRHRWRRVLLLLGVLILVLLGAFVGYYRHLDHVYDEQVSAALERADRLDGAWRLDDLEAKRAVVPDEENSALRIRTAHSQLPPGWPPPRFGDALKDQPPQVMLDAEQANVLRAELAKVAAALTTAPTLKDYPRGRHPMTLTADWISTPEPHVSDVRTMASLLDGDCRLRAQDGEADGACDSVRALLNAGRSLGDEPLLISPLTRFGIHDVALRSLERTLALGAPSETSLAAAQRLIDDELREPVLLRALRSERAGMHQFVTQVEAGAIRLNRVSKRGPQPIKGAEFISDVWVRPLVKQGHAEIVDALTDFIESAKLPVEQQESLPEAIRARTAKMGPFAEVYFPGYATVAAISLRTQAELRCALVGIALERYRRRHDRWPNALADVVPEFIIKLPLDPFDGQQLRYRRDDQGVIVYSIGADRKDDGGDQATLNTHKDGTDLGFRLWDLDRRRQPPPPAK